ncbi:putative myosin light chain kinase [Porphyridium purpureum]|uniref:Putative myosin light chain kinase n=1 Tax=Porphyridium purpureum TaxID=35688 RepID=A0A5J4YX87_PORPP|nr:putative myosin light chain kinase [Porphyridium purpureum]|eukprot:POR0253..scf209_3
MRMKEDGNTRFHMPSPLSPLAGPSVGPADRQIAEDGRLAAHSRPPPRAPAAAAAETQLRPHHSRDRTRDSESLEGDADADVRPPPLSRQRSASICSLPSFLDLSSSGDTPGDRTPSTLRSNDGSTFSSFGGTALGRRLNAAKKRGLPGAFESLKLDQEGSYSMKRATSETNMPVLKPHSDDLTDLKPSRSSSQRMLGEYVLVKSPQAPYPARRYVELVWGSMIFCRFKEETPEVSWWLNLAVAELVIDYHDPLKITLRDQRVSCRDDPKLAAAAEYSFSFSAPHVHMLWYNVIKVGITWNFLNTYTIERPIGHGAYANIYLARRRGTDDENLLRALRFLKIADVAEGKEITASLLLREVRIVTDIVSSQVSCPYLLQFYDIMVDTHSIVFVSEWVPNGSLDRVLGARSGPLSEAEACRVMYCVFSGVAELHARSIMHRDIKPENVLVVDSIHFKQCKLCDFGLARYYTWGRIGGYAEEDVRSLVGSPWYVAPECAREEPYGQKVDAWSCGVLLYYLLTYSYPVDGGSTEETLQMIAANPRVDFSPLAPVFSADVISLLKGLLQANPLRRMDAKKALQSNWFKELRDEQDATKV